MNAFTESLALELRAFNIRVGLIPPGTRPADPVRGKRPPDDGAAPGELVRRSASRIFDSMQDNASVTQATDVAQAVWRMVHDPDAPSRLPAGKTPWRWRRPVIALPEGNMRDLSVRQWVRKLPCALWSGNIISVRIAWII